ncbi:MAG: indolepyruvate oxidoreductase subunit beta [Desulfobacterium sp.]|jgi:indolepyruvate ferredoxin oxidoreductase beta subunit|nr:indolepyruvate oxidoreductase subunit beta [Desulfobacterium sp.]
MDVKRLIMVAVGGQGNLLASKVLGEAALICKVPVKMSEIHGMAQRGGVVESALVFGDAQSTIISDGDADLLLGFEPSETLRAMNRCNSSSTVITNLDPVPPFTVAIGRGVYPDMGTIKALIRGRTARLIAFDAMALAKEAGSPMTMNIVLVGALIQTCALPLTRESVERAIETRTKKAFVDMNLAAFDLGFKAAQQE